MKREKKLVIYLSDEIYSRLKKVSTESGLSLSEIGRRGTQDALLELEEDYGV